MIESIPIVARLRRACACLDDRQSTLQPFALLYNIDESFNIIESADQQLSQLVRRPFLQRLLLCGTFLPLLRERLRRASFLRAVSFLCLYCRNFNAEADELCTDLMKVASSALDTSPYLD